MSGYMEAMLVLLAINTILAYSASLPLSTGQLNLGIAGFMAIGAYVSAYLTNEMAFSLWLALPAGGVVAAAIAIAIGLPILRTHGIYLALATFSLGEIIKTVFLNLEVVGGASGYPVAEYMESTTVWAIAIAVFGFMFLLSQSRFSLYLTAIKNDPTVADLFGLNVKRLQLSSIAIGSFLAAIAGGAYAHQFSYVEAQYFSALLNIYIVLFVILGGVQTVYGPLIGAVYFTFLPEVLRFSEEWRFVVFAAFIIFFMAWRSEGIVTSSSIRKLRRFFTRREPVRW